MTLVRFDDNGPVPPLRRGEILRCLNPECGAVYDAPAYEGSGLPSPDDVPVEHSRGQAQCPACYEVHGLVRHDLTARTPLEQRWGEAGRDFVAMPNVLRRHRRLLGLDSIDLDLLAELIAH